MKHILLFIRFSYILLFSLFISCQKEDTLREIPFEDLEKLEKQVTQNSLLIKKEEKGLNTFLYFEMDTISLPSGQIESIDIQKENWVTHLTLKNNKEPYIIPTQGDNIKEYITKLTLAKYSPLSAELQLSLPIRSKVKVRIKSLGKKQTDLVHIFDKFGYNHAISIHGLYANKDNQVEVIILSEHNLERASINLNIETEEVKERVLPKIEVTKCSPSEMEEGLTLVNYMGDIEFDTHCPFMIDTDGEIRWILLLKSHPVINNITAHIGFQRLKNGNFIFGDVKTNVIFEVDMLGNVINSWDIESMGYEFHHEVTEMPNKNLLITATKLSSKLENGVWSIYDYIIELHRETGAVVTEWDLKKSLDELRNSVSFPGGQAGNWAHNNAVYYSNQDDCIIASLRNQGIVKLTRTNEVVWILAPHLGWERKGLKEKLLHPLDNNGIMITAPDIINGKKGSEDFDWSWATHNPTLLPNGNLLVFDNGFFRNFKMSTNEYSRAVEYKIDESQKTVQEIWQYGKERGLSCFAPAVSSAQFLEGTNNILFAPGIGSPNNNGMGGKIVEVDYKTREVVFEAELSTPSSIVFHRATRMPLYPD